MSDCSAIAYMKLGWLMHSSTDTELGNKGDIEIKIAYIAQKRVQIFKELDYSGTSE